MSRQCVVGGIRFVLNSLKVCSGHQIQREKAKAISSG